MALVVILRQDSVDEQYILYNIHSMSVKGYSRIEISQMILEATC